MRGTILFSLTVFLLIATFTKGYGQMRNITITSYEIVSYNYFTDKLTLNLTVKNDSSDFVLKSFTGLVYQNKQPIVNITAANLSITNGISSIGVVCNVSRCTGVSLLRLAQCFLPFIIKNFTVDVSVAIQYPNSPIQHKKQKGICLSTRIVAN